MQFSFILFNYSQLQNLNVNVAQLNSSALLWSIPLTLNDLNVFISMPKRGRNLRLQQLILCVSMAIFASWKLQQVKKLRFLFTRQIYCVFHCSWWINWWTLKKTSLSFWRGCVIFGSIIMLQCLCVWGLRGNKMGKNAPTYVINDVGGDE